MRKLYIYLSLLAIASFILAACAPAAGGETGGETGGEPSTGGFASDDPTTFTEATFGDIDTLDPALAYDTASAGIIFNVYEPLVFFAGEKLDEFVPVLAESYEVSEDGSVWTFNIRQGVTFHEGGELTPSDVAYSFTRGILQGGYISPQWLLAEPFFGPGNDDISIMVDGGASADDRELLAANDPATLAAVCEQLKSQIVADDAAGTVTMTLAGPWGPFIPTITQSWGSIMDMEWVIENGGWDGSCDTWQNFYAMQASEDPFTGIANGTGPFKLDHWTPGEEIVLTRNDSYWGEPAKLERVVKLFIDEWGTRFAMLQAGDADTADLGSTSDAVQVHPLAGEVCVWNAESVAYDCEIVDDSLPLREAMGRPGLIQTVIIYNFGLVTEGNPYVGSGTLDGNGIPADFFNDVHIRKGFSYSFDPETYIADVLNGEGAVSVSLPLPGMPGYDPDAPHYSLDLEAAAAEFKLADLDHDGIAAGDDPEGDVWTTGFRVQMMYNLGNTARQSTAEILASNLASVNELFSVEVLGLPWPSYLAAQRAHQIPIMPAGWLEDIHDPHNWYQPYTTGAYGSRQGMPDDLKAQFQALLEAGVAETDPDARHQIYLEMNQLYYDLNPGLILPVALGHSFRQRWVEGLIANPIFPDTWYYTISKN